MGGVYYGTLAAAARNAFRMNDGIRRTRVAGPVGVGDSKQATFWLRLRNRFRNIYTLIKVKVIQKPPSDTLRKNFKRFVKKNAKCGEGRVLMNQIVHDYKVEKLEGPILYERDSEGMSVSATVSPQ